MKELEVQESDIQASYFNNSLLGGLDIDGNFVVL
jgi:hypothetical protein